MQGINCTIFAFGQTCSGKTFTIRGNKESPGLIPLSIEEIFRKVEEIKERKFKLAISFMEIYNEIINDLLVNESTKLEMKENGNSVNIKGLSDTGVLRNCVTLSKCPAVVHIYK